MSKGSESRWTEVNVLPADAPQSVRLLAEVVDPLVHRVLKGRWDNWHFFWEPELRLRFHWAPAFTPDACRELVAAHLERVHQAGGFHSWWETPYKGEAREYGPEVWQAVMADWMSSSELALAIFKAGKRLTRSRFHHWSRHAHLFANQADVPEVTACLWQAAAYLGQWETESPVVGDVLAAIDRFLEDATMLKAEQVAYARTLRRTLEDMPAGEPVTQAP